MKPDGLVLPASPPKLRWYFKPNRFNPDKDKIQLVEHKLLWTKVHGTIDLSMVFSQQDLTYYASQAIDNYKRRSPDDRFWEWAPVIFDANTREE